MSQKYEEIKAFLKEEALKPESRTRMPTIMELMQRFRASQSPVSRAVHDLEKEGVLYCRRGTGIVSRSGHAPFTVKPPKEVAKLGTVALFSVEYFSSAIWQMEHTLCAYSQQLGFALRTCRLQRDSDRMKLLRDALKLEDLRGIIFLSSADRLEGELIELFGEFLCPVVIQDSYFTYDNLPGNVSVLMPDAFRNGMEYIKYFHGRGHRKVGLIRGVPDGTIPQQMIAGALEAAAEFDMELSVFSNAIKSWESSREASRKITLDSIEAIRQLNSLIYFGLGGVLAGRRVLWEQGIRVPDEISLFSHGDDPLFDECCPAITSSRTDFTAMSRDALDIITGSLPRQAVRLYPATLINRESIATLEGEEK